MEEENQNNPVEPEVREPSLAEKLAAAGDDLAEKERLLSEAGYYKKVERHIPEEVGGGSLGELGRDLDRAREYTRNISEIERMKGGSRGR